MKAGEGPSAYPLACPSPSAYPLALPRKMCCSPTVNSLMPFFARASTPPAPAPVSDAGQEGEHEVELLLNRRLVRRRRATLCGRLRVPAAGGADALPGEGGGVRRRGPTPPRRPPGRARRHARSCSSRSPARAATSYFARRVSAP